MLKRASKSALGISLGTTIGMVMIPRIMDPNLNKIYPPIFVQTVVQFVASYIVAFLIFLLLDYFKLKKKEILE